MLATGTAPSKNSLLDFQQFLPPPVAVGNAPDFESLRLFSAHTCLKPRGVNDSGG
jgi:hypothetical protein